MYVAEMSQHQQFTSLFCMYKSSNLCYFFYVCDFLNYTHTFTSVDILFRLILQHMIHLATGKSQTCCVTIRWTPVVGVMVIFT